MVSEVSGGLKTEENNFEKRLAVFNGQLVISSERWIEKEIGECCLRSLVYF